MAAGIGSVGEMVESIVQQDTRTYNAVISASEVNGKWQLALGLLAEVPYSTVQQKTITCNASISACEKYGTFQASWPNDCEHSAARHHDLHRCDQH